MGRGLTKEEHERREELFKHGLVVCGHCGQALSVDCFHKDKNRKYGVKNTCKNCAKETQIRYKNKNRKQINEKAKEYYNQNKDSIQEKAIEKRQTVRDRYSNWKSKTKARGLSFDLTLDEFDAITSQPCYYCGVLSEHHLGYRYVGIDRVDSSKGYSPDNVVPCCGTCNWMKSDREVTDWIHRVRKIINHLDNYKITF